MIMTISWDHQKRPSCTLGAVGRKAKDAILYCYAKCCPLPNVVPCKTEYVFVFWQACDLLDIQLSLWFNSGAQMRRKVPGEGCLNRNKSQLWGKALNCPTCHFCFKNGTLFPCFCITGAVPPLRIKNCRHHMLFVPDLCLVTDL